MNTFESERDKVWYAIDALARQETLPAVRQARELLRDWVNKHPEDYYSRDGGEELAMLEEALEIITKEQASEPMAA